MHRAAQHAHRIAQHNNRLQKSPPPRCRQPQLRLGLCSSPPTLRSTTSFSRDCAPSTWKTPYADPDLTFLPFSSCRLSNRSPPETTIRASPSQSISVNHDRDRDRSRNGPPGDHRLAEQCPRPDASASAWSQARAAWEPYVLPSPARTRGGLPLT